MLKRESETRVEGARGKERRCSLNRRPMANVLRAKLDERRATRQEAQEAAGGRRQKELKCGVVALLL
jgi:hypothetical protein